MDKPLCFYFSKETGFAEISQSLRLRHMSSVINGHFLRICTIFSEKKLLVSQNIYLLSIKNK